MKHCKICGSLSQDDAVKCAFCNSDFGPATIKQRKHKNKELTQTVKPPMNRVAVFLLLLAFSYLPILPVAVAVSNSTYSSGKMLLICWVFVFIVSLIVYRFATTNARSAAEYDSYAPVYGNDEENAVAENNTQSDRLESEEPEYATAPIAPGHFTNSPFSNVLYDIYRQADHFSTPAYHAEMNFENALRALVAHHNSFDVNTARSFLSALAARRMILLCGNNETEFGSAIEGIQGLTGENATTIKLDYNCTTPHRLYVAEGSDSKPTPSLFLRSLYGAHTRKKSICPFLLNADAPEKLNTSFEDIKPYLENSMIEGKITVKGANRTYSNVATDEVVLLPANTRLFLSHRPGSSTPLPQTLMDVCAFINLKGDISAVQVMNTLEKGALPFDRFQHLCNEAEERFALSEENWKKIDDLAEHLAAKSFVLDNKLVTAMERFVGVYMATGGTEQAALDAVFASILLPAALSVVRFETSEERAELSQFLDACFGLENLPACTEMMKKFNAA